jgi:methionine synthase I (cobalamin-dependent)
VADASLIEDGVNLSFVVDGAFGQAAHLRPFGGREGIHDSLNVTRPESMFAFYSNYAENA